MVKPSAPFAVLAVMAAFALTGCTAPPDVEATAATPAPVAADETASPTATTTPTPEPQACSRLSEIRSHGDELYVSRVSPLMDLGAREFAAGEVTLDDEGNVATYTVAPGDVEAVIAERLCAYPALASMNHVRILEPGQVLWLNPDPETPWLNYFSPPGAPEGLDQIAYQRAMDSARIAVDAGDIDAVRAVSRNELSSMLTIPEQVEAIEQVLDSGDLDALRQLFS